MKILHTSDWHLGHVLFGHDRSAEQAAFLEQLTDIVCRHQPDALVVSGDIYHTAMPSAAAQKLFTDALLAIHHACRPMTIIVIGGNHDSASKLDIDRQLWHELGIHVLGRLQTGADLQPDFSQHIIAVGDAGIVAAIPHFYPQNLPPAAGDDRQRAFFARLADEVTRRNPQGLPAVLMAHLTVAGSDLTGHTTYPDSIGTIESVPLPLLGDGYAYIALGHIHHAQMVGRTGRYCGSPLAVSFDEDYVHSVSLVDVEHDGQLHIQALPISTAHPLLTLPRQAVPFDEAVAALATSTFGDTEPYVRLNILTAGGLPDDAVEQATQAATQAGARFCTFRLTRPATQRTSPTIDITPDELKEASPIDIARRYLAQRGVADEGLTDLLQHVVDTLNEEDRQ